MPETGQYGSTRGFWVTPELYSIIFSVRFAGLKAILM